MDNRIILNFDEIKLLSPTALKLRCLLIQFCKNKHEIYLPARDELIRFLKCSNYLLNKSLKELEQNGIIKVSNPYICGMKTRRRIVVKYLDLKIVEEVKQSELISDVETTLNDTQKKIYKLLCNPKLKELKIEELKKLSYNAPEEHILIALKEILNYNQEVNNIKALYRSRFRVRNFKGELDPARKNKLWNFETSNKIDSNFSFYPIPDIGFFVSDVDRVSEVLNSYTYLNTDEIPQNLLRQNLSILKFHKTENMITLSDSFKLEQKKPGYWTAKKIDIDLSRKGNESGPKQIKDILSVIYEL